MAKAVVSTVSLLLFFLLAGASADRFLGGEDQPVCFLHNTFGENPDYHRYLTSADLNVGVNPDTGIEMTTPYFYNVQEDRDVYNRMTYEFLQVDPRDEFFTKRTRRYYGDKCVDFRQKNHVVYPYQSRNVSGELRIAVNSNLTRLRHRIAPVYEPQFKKNFSNILFNYTARFVPVTYDILRSRYDNGTGVYVHMAGIYVIKFRIIFTPKKRVDVHRWFLPDQFQRLVLLNVSLETNVNSILLDGRDSSEEFEMVVERDDGLYMDRVQAMPVNYERKSLKRDGNYVYTHLYKLGDAVWTLYNKPTHRKECLHAWDNGSLAEKWRLAQAYVDWSQQLPVYNTLLEAMRCRPETFDDVLTFMLYVWVKENPFTIFPDWWVLQSWRNVPYSENLVVSVARRVCDTKLRKAPKTKEIRKEKQGPIAHVRKTRSVDSQLSQHVFGQDHFPDPDGEQEEEDDDEDTNDSTEASSTVLNIDFEMGRMPWEESGNDVVVVQVDDRFSVGQNEEFELYMKDLNGDVVNGVLQLIAIQKTGTGDGGLVSVAELANITRKLYNLTQEMPRAHYTLAKPVPNRNWSDKIHVRFVTSDNTCYNSKEQTWLEWIAGKLGFASKAAQLYTCDKPIVVNPIQKKSSIEGGDVSQLLQVAIDGKEDVEVFIEPGVVERKPILEGTDNENDSAFIDIVETVDLYGPAHTPVPQPKHDDSPVSDGAGGKIRKKRALGDDRLPGHQHSGLSESQQHMEPPPHPGPPPPWGSQDLLPPPPPPPPPPAPPMLQGGFNPYFNFRDAPPLPPPPSASAASGGGTPQRVQLKPFGGKDLKSPPPVKPKPAGSGKPKAPDGGARRESSLPPVGSPMLATKTVQKVGGGEGGGPFLVRSGHGGAMAFGPQKSLTDRGPGSSSPPLYAKPRKPLGRGQQPIPQFVIDLVKGPDAVVPEARPGHFHSHQQPPQREWEARGEEGGVKPLEKLFHDEKTGLSVKSRLTPGQPNDGLLQPPHDRWSQRNYPHGGGEKPPYPLSQNPSSVKQPLGAGDPWVLRDTGLAGFPPQPSNAGVVRVQGQYKQPLPLPPSIPLSSSSSSSSLSLSSSSDVSVVESRRTYEQPESGGLGGGKVKSKSFVPDFLRDLKPWRKKYEKNHHQMVNVKVRITDLETKQPSGWKSMLLELTQELQRLETDQKKVVRDMVGVRKDGGKLGETQRALADGKMGPSDQKQSSSQGGRPDSGPVPPPAQAEPKRVSDQKDGSPPRSGGGPPQQQQQLPPPLGQPSRDAAVGGGAERGGEAAGAGGGGEPPKKPDKKLPDDKQGGPDESKKQPPRHDSSSSGDSLGNGKKKPLPPVRSDSLNRDSFSHGDGAGGEAKGVVGGSGRAQAARGEGGGGARPKEVQPRGAAGGVPPPGEMPPDYAKPFGGAQGGNPPPGDLVYRGNPLTQNGDSPVRLNGKGPYGLPVKKIVFGRRHYLPGADGTFTEPVTHIRAVVASVSLEYELDPSKKKLQELTKSNKVLRDVEHDGKKHARAHGKPWPIPGVAQASQIVSGVHGAPMVVYGPPLHQHTGHGHHFHFLPGGNTGFGLDLNLQDRYIKSLKLRAYYNPGDKRTQKLLTHAEKVMVKLVDDVKKFEAKNPDRRSGWLLNGDYPLNPNEHGLSQDDVDNVHRGRGDDLPQRKRDEFRRRGSLNSGGSAKPVHKSASFQGGVGPDEVPAVSLRKKLSSGTGSRPVSPVRGAVGGAPRADSPVRGAEGGARALDREDPNKQLAPESPRKPIPKPLQRPPSPPGSGPKPVLRGNEKGPPPGAEGYIVGQHGGDRAGAPNMAGNERSLEGAAGGRPLSGGGRARSLDEIESPRVRYSSTGSLRSWSSMTDLERRLAQLRDPYHRGGGNVGPIDATGRFYVRGQYVDSGSLLSVSTHDSVGSGIYVGQMAGQLQMEVATAEQTAKSLRDEIRGMRTQYDNLRSEIQTREKHGVSTKELNHLKARLHQYGEALSSYSHMHGHYTAYAEMTRQRLIIVEQEREETKRIGMRNEIRKLTEQRQIKTDQLGVLKDNADMEEHRLNRLQKEIRDLEAAGKPLPSQLRNEFLRQRQSLEASSGAIKKVQGDVIKIDAELARVNARLDQYKPVGQPPPPGPAQQPVALPLPDSASGTSDSSAKAPVKPASSQDPAPKAIASGGKRSSGGKSTEKKPMPSGPAATPKQVRVGGAGGEGGGGFAAAFVVTSVSSALSQGIQRDIDSIISHKYSAMDKPIAVTLQVLEQLDRAGGQAAMGGMMMTMMGNPTGMAVAGSGMGLQLLTGVVTFAVQLYQTLNPKDVHEDPLLQMYRVYAQRVNGRDTGNAWCLMPESKLQVTLQYFEHSPHREIPEGKGLAYWAAAPITKIMADYHPLIMSNHQLKIRCAQGALKFNDFNVEAVAQMIEPGVWQVHKIAAMLAVQPVVTAQCGEFVALEIRRRQIDLAETTLLRKRDSSEPPGSEMMDSDVCDVYPFKKFYVHMDSCPHEPGVQHVGWTTCGVLFKSAVWNAQNSSWAIMNPFARPQSDRKVFIFTRRDFRADEINPLINSYHRQLCANGDQLSMCRLVETFELSDTRECRNKVRWFRLRVAYLEDLSLGHVQGYMLTCPLGAIAKHVLKHGRQENIFVQNVDPYGAAKKYMFLNPHENVKSVLWVYCQHAANEFLKSDVLEIVPTDKNDRPEHLHVWNAAAGKITFDEEPFKENFTMSAMYNISRRGPYEFTQNFLTTTPVYEPDNIRFREDLGETSHWTPKTDVTSTKHIDNVYYTFKETWDLTEIDTHYTGEGRNKWWTYAKKGCKATSSLQVTVAACHVDSNRDLGVRPLGWFLWAWLDQSKGEGSTLIKPTDVWTFKAGPDTIVHSGVEYKHLMKDCRVSLELDTRELTVICDKTSIRPHDVGDYDSVCLFAAPAKDKCELENVACGTVSREWERPKIKRNGWNMGISYQSELYYAAGIAPQLWPNVFCVDEGYYSSDIDYSNRYTVVAIMRPLDRMLPIDPSFESGNAVGTRDVRVKAADYAQVEQLQTALSQLYDMRNDPLAASINEFATGLTSGGKNITKVNVPAAYVLKAKEIRDAEIQRITDEIAKITQELVMEAFRRTEFYKQMVERAKLRCCRLRLDKNYQLRVEPEYPDNSFHRCNEPDYFVHPQETEFVWGPEYSYESRYYLRDQRKNKPWYVCTPAKEIIFENEHVRNQFYLTLIEERISDNLTGTLDLTQAGLTETLDVVTSLIESGDLDTSLPDTPTLVVSPNHHDNTWNVHVEVDYDRLFSYLVIGTVIFVVAISTVIIVWCCCCLTAKRRIACALMRFRCKRYCCGKNATVKREELDSSTTFSSPANSVEGIYTCIDVGRMSSKASTMQLKKRPRCKYADTEKKRVTAMAGSSSNNSDAEEEEMLLVQCDDKGAELDFF